MIDKTQMKIPSTIRGGCKGSGKVLRWACAVGDVGAGVMEKLNDGIVMPYWGFQWPSNRPAWFWDQEDEELRTVSLLALADEDPPRFALFFGTVTDHLPDLYRNWTEFELEVDPWPDLDFEPPWYNLLGVPVIWTLHSLVQVSFYRTYDELKLGFPAAHDPKWLEIED